MTGMKNGKLRGEETNKPPGAEPGGVHSEEDRARDQSFQRTPT